MKPSLLLAALVAAGLAACGDEPPRPRVSPEPATSGAGAAPAPSTTTRPSTTPSAPAAGGATSIEERKEGANPVQQQVDPKEAEQRRDFQHPRDGEGPTSPETQPRN
jgi:hypothetical protein